MTLFKELIHRVRPHRPEEPDKLSPAKVDAMLNSFGLNDWVTSDACTQLFLPYLDRLIFDCDVEEGEALLSHVSMAFARGKREALKELRAEFNNWRENAL